VILSALVEGIRLAFTARFGFSKSIRWLMILGWLTLPYSHLKWLPDLGTTRPLSALMFGAAFALIFFSDLFQNRISFTNMVGWGFFTRSRQSLPGWKFTRWWLLLIGTGVLSAAITPFYGSFPQALSRLLGYALIFIFLYCALYSLKEYGIEVVARWISIGYLPILVYAIIEALAVLHVPPAISIVLTIRAWLVVPFPWVNRISLLATESSFVAFQLVLLIAVLPFVKNRLLRTSNLIIIFISFLFSESGTLFSIIAAYAGFLLFFYMTRQQRIVVSTGAATAALAGGLIYCLTPTLQIRIEKIWDFISANSGRLDNMRLSFIIRGAYILNLIYTIIETKGLGVGIGQYGLYWKDTYLRHIDYKSFDRYGEVEAALRSSIYMKPWSVIFGIGADLGIIGMAIFFIFFYQLFQCCKSTHNRAVVLTGLIALVGAYPIVTPHVWLAFALMGGHGLISYADSVHA
jgi:hypothetical protein